MIPREKKRFISLVCWLFGFVTLFSNVICILVPIFLSFDIPETKVYADWEQFLRQNELMLSAVNILSFALPVVLCVLYLSGINKGKENLVRIVNAPIVLSLVGIGNALGHIQSRAIAEHLFYRDGKMYFGARRRNQQIHRGLRYGDFWRACRNLGCEENLILPR